MSQSKHKGTIGLINVIADLLEQGGKISLPIDENCQYDLIVDFQKKLYKVQVKYVTSKNGQLTVKTRSTNSKCEIRYSNEDFDVLAVWDNTDKQAYYISSSLIKEKMTEMTLRLHSPKNNQTKLIRWAKDYKQFQAAVA